MKMNKDIDSISRNRIVSDTDTNFFVEAGAGSGKTTMLVSRMVAMVEQGKDISKICAITFTKAAANEFYERFQKLLAERSSEDYVWVDNGFAGQLPEPTEETRRRCEEALKNIDLCFMGTIDSFCNMVLSEHPFEAGIPSDATIMTEKDAAVLYKQLFVAMCKGTYGEELAAYARLFRSVHWDSEEVFAVGMKEVMENRNVHFNFNEVEAVDIDAKYRETKKNINTALNCLKEHKDELMVDKVKTNLAAWDKLWENSRRLNFRWSTNFKAVLMALKGISDIRVKSEAMDKYAVSLGDVFKPTEKKKSDYLEFSYGDVYDELLSIQYNASMTFLIKSIPVVEQAMRESGALGFFDYLYYLRNMLKKDAEGEGKLIRYIYDHHSYFLIDEFQDTNPMQAEVFFYLCSENPVPKWNECTPRPGSLFIVGDPKQSIYRFRSADVTSFLNVKKLFEQGVGEILYLTKNFRSTRKMCSHFNDVFESMLPEETENQSKFEPIPLVGKDCEEFQGIYTYESWQDSRAKIEEKIYMTDPNRIKSIIKNIVNNQEFLITDQGSDVLRPIRYGDIMVITYGKDKLEGISKALYKCNIPCRVEGKVSFETNMALVTVTCIFKALSDPEDTQALYGALSGEMFLLPDNDMVYFVKHGGKITLKRPVPTEDIEDVTFLKVAKLINRFNELYIKARVLSPAALFEFIMEEFEVYRRVDSKNMEVLCYTLELLRNGEKSGTIVTLKDGCAYLDNLIDGLSEEERCLRITDDNDCVHLANLHKVKGLEAPVVILAQAGTKANAASARYIHGNAGDEGYIFSINTKTEEGQRVPYFSTNTFEEEKKMEGESLKAEADRLIYVAATRARNALIICDYVTFTNETPTHRSRWKPLMINHPKDFFEHFNITDIDDNVPEVSETDPNELYAKASESCVLNDRSAEEITYKLENPSRTSVKSKLVDEATDDVDDEDTVVEKSTTEIHGLPTVLGTMTHKLMEMMVVGSGDDSRIVGEVIREFITLKTRPYEKQLIDALTKVAERMRSGGYRQVNSVPGDLLTALKSAEEVYCEVPFCYKEEDIIWNGVMDLVYKKDGQWHIVDYKTNADGNDLDKKYQNQLQAYVNAFKAITGETADAHTYHIDI